MRKFAEFLVLLWVVVRVDRPDSGDTRCKAVFIAKGVIYGSGAEAGLTLSDATGAFDVGIRNVSPITY